MANQIPPPDSPSIAILKRQWRQYLRKIRQELDPKRRKEAELLAHDQLYLLCQSARWVLSFASFGSEINLWPFNQLLATEGRLILPKLLEDNLVLIQVTNFSSLELHSLGMLEPKCNFSCLNPSLLDIALIPGLGFDIQTRHRLGYGKGYYDRLLTSLGRTQTWGIGFREQAVEHLPYTQTDKSLERIYLF